MDEERIAHQSDTCGSGWLGECVECAKPDLRCSDDSYRVVSNREIELTGQLFKLAESARRHFVHSQAVLTIARKLADESQAWRDVVTLLEERAVTAADKGEI